MSDWTYKGVPAPINDGTSYGLDMGAWSRGVDAALGSTRESFESLLLDRIGYVDGAETSADGSADNDLAHERAQAVLKFIELVKNSSVPESFIPETKYALVNYMYYRWTENQLTVMPDKTSNRFLSSDFLDWDDLVTVKGNKVVLPLDEVPEWAR